MSNKQDILKQIASIDEQIQKFSDKKKILVSDLKNYIITSQCKRLDI